MLGGVWHGYSELDQARRRRGRTKQEQVLGTVVPSYGVQLPPAKLPGEVNEKMGGGLAAWKGG